MFLRHVLFHAVSTEFISLAFEENSCLIDRVAQGMAGITANDQNTFLGHEPAHVANGTVDHNMQTFERDAASCRGIPSITSRPP